MYNGLPSLVNKPKDIGMNLSAIVERPFEKLVEAMRKASPMLIEKAPRGFPKS